MIINVLYITPPENYYENGKPTILKMYLWLEMVMFQPVMFVFFLGGGRYICQKIQAPNPISPNQGARSNIQVQRTQPELHWQCPSTTFHIRLGGHLSQFHLKSLLWIGREMEGLIECLGRLWVIESQVAMLRLYGC